MADVIRRVLKKTLIESLRVPGARTPGRLATWSEGTPELPLILSLVAEAFLQLLASGLGTLALVWATVVLLGGYSTTLVRTDFWFTTAIVFIEIARIVGYNSAPEAKFFVDVPAAFYQLKKHDFGVASAMNIVRRLAIGSTWIALAPIFLATACVSLSIIRLASIGDTHSYRYISSSSGNMKPALNLFYGLVLAQGALFLLWLAVAVNRMASVETLTEKYSSWQHMLLQQQLWRVQHQHQRLLHQHQQQQQLQQQLKQLKQQPQPQPLQEWLQEHRLQQQLQQQLQQLQRLQQQLQRLQQQQQQHNLPRKLIDRYVNSIADACTQKGVGSTMNSTLVSFAAELLLQSHDLDDHSYAVVVLHSLVVKDTERSGRTAEQISCDEKLVSRLLWMLRSNNPVTKVCIAEIVVELASNYELRLVDIPGGARCISSLLDPHFMKKEEEAIFFVRGLEILGKLASDSENCREIYNTMDLVPKIIAPVSSGLHMVMKDDVSTTTVEVVIAESLRVVAKLTSGTGESSRKLCEELTTTEKYGRTAENILWILSNSEDQDMRVLAVEILSRLSLDESIMLTFTKTLRLLTCEESPLGIEAGKALVARGDMLAEYRRVHVIMNGDKYSKEYRAVTAEMFNFHNLFEPAAHGKKMFISFAGKLLSEVFEAIVTETTNITQLDNSNRKFLASFLNLAVQIIETKNLVTARDFAIEVPVSFADKLKSIIEVTKDSKSKDEACLAIMKSATKLVTWMMEIDDGRSPNYYMDYFQRYNIVEKLDTALKAMVHLERYMVITGGADKNGGYVTLQTLVETVKNKKLQQKQPPPPPPPPQQPQTPQEQDQ